MNEARLYTLRIWRHHDAFRAALRAVGEVQTELFTEPAAVADHLDRALGPAVPAAPAGPPAGPGTAPEPTAAPEAPEATAPIPMTRNTPGEP